LGFSQVTAKKIRLFTTRDTWEPVLRELIDPSELPLEYGGTGPNRLREYLEQGGLAGLAATSDPTRPAERMKAPTTLAPAIGTTPAASLSSDLRPVAAASTTTTTTTTISSEKFSI
jgi:hypothetical protein